MRQPRWRALASTAACGGGETALAESKGEVSPGHSSQRSGVEPRGPVTAPAWGLDGWGDLGLAPSGADLERVNVELVSEFVGG
jgi:hypothetical protein